MALTPVVCVYQLMGKKCRYVGVYFSDAVSPDPEDSYVAIAARNGGFSVFMSMEEFEMLLTQEGKTNLLELVQEKMAKAPVVNSRRGSARTSNEKLLLQLKRALGVTGPI